MDMENSPAKKGSWGKRLRLHTAELFYYFQKAYPESEDKNHFLDYATQVYVHKMNALGKHSQKIVHYLAKSDDNMSASDIGLKTRMDSKSVSAHISGLRKKGIVKIVDKKRHANIYSIACPTFKQWYQFRYKH